MLVAEFTLTENPANTTTSLLRAVCHADDSVILGTWLQETDHRTIEDQVGEWSTKLLFYVVGGVLCSHFPSCVNGGEWEGRGNLMKVVQSSEFIASSNWEHSYSSGICSCFV